MSSTRRDDIGRRLKAARAGLKTGLPKGTKSLKVGDTTYSVSALDKVFAELEALYDAVIAAHALLNKRVDERDAALPEARALLADFKVAIVALLGRTNERLVDFGVKPQRPRARAERKPKDTSKPGVQA